MLHSRLIASLVIPHAIIGARLSDITEAVTVETRAKALVDATLPPIPSEVTHQPIEAGSRLPELELQHPFGGLVNNVEASLRAHVSEDRKTLRNKAGIKVIYDALAADKSTREKLDQLIKCGRGKVILFGDSLTYQGHWSTPFSFAQMVKEVLEFGSKGRITVINAGVPGDSARGAINRIEKDVIGRGPDVVFVLFGSNDSAHWVGPEDFNPKDSKANSSLEKYTAQLTTVVQSLNRCGIEVFLGTPPPLLVSEGADLDKPIGWGKGDDGASWIPREAMKFVAAARMIAANEKVALNDYNSVLSQYGARNIIIGKNDDILHVNLPGHIIMARMVIDKLSKSRLVRK